MAKKKTSTRPKPTKLTEPYDVGGPFLAAAVFCDRVMTETDRVPSIFRIVDVLTITPTTHQVAPEDIQSDVIVGINLNFYFQMRAGQNRKDMRFELYVVAPDGTRERYGHGELPFSNCKANHDSVNGTMPLKLKWKGDGYYWYELFLENKLITKLPLFVRVGRDSEGEKSNEG